MNPSQKISWPKSHSPATMDRRSKHWPRDKSFTSDMAALCMLQHGRAYKIETAESWNPSGIHKWRIHSSIDVRYRQRGELLPHQGGCTGAPTLAKEGRLAVNDQQADRILADTFATAGNGSSAAS
jgi:hypothetical protein